MYSPTTYYFGCFFSNLVISLFYPVIMIGILFFNMGTVTSMENFGWMMGFGLLSNSAFSG